MTTTKSFNSSSGNIGGRAFVVPKTPIFGANGSCTNFENAQGFCVLVRRLIFRLVVGPTNSRVLSALTRYH
jgi:hypothetical protein